MFSFCLFLDDIEGIASIVMIRMSGVFEPLEAEN